MRKISMMMAALVLMASGIASAAGYECSAIANASAPRTTPRTVVATGATREEARKAALSACSAAAAPAATCRIIRCTPVR